MPPVSTVEHRDVAVSVDAGHGRLGRAAVGERDRDRIADARCGRWSGPGRRPMTTPFAPRQPPPRRTTPGAAVSAMPEATVAPRSSSEVVMVDAPCLLA